MRNGSRWLLAGIVSVVMIMGTGVPAIAGPSSTSNAGTASGDDPSLWDTLRGWFTGNTAKLDKEPPKSVDLKLDGVPRDDPARTGTAWAAPKRVKELTGRRSQNARYYQLSDGRVQAEISQTPLHYRVDGAWKPIDLTVREGSGGWALANTSNAFASRFGDRSDRLARFEAQGRHIELGLAGPPSAVTPVAAGSTVTYKGAASGADVVYEVTPTTLQEDFVLSARPAQPFSVTMTVKTGGLVARQIADGSIEFTGRGDGRVVFVMPAPYMFDAKDDAGSDVGKVMSRKVGQTLTQRGATAEITITPDAAWLADPARVYPVTIDPTVKIQPVPSDGQDVEIYSGATTTNYNNTYQLKVGTEATHTWRSLVRFPLTGVPTGTPIDDAQLQLYYSQTHWDWSYDVALEARKVTTPWSESTATWANMNANIAAQPAGNVITVDDGDAGTSFSGTWPYSTNPLAAKAIGGDYRYNNDATGGHTHTWTPTITEAGDYQVEVHFTAEADRSTATPYTVYYNGGSKAYSVDQTGAADGVWKTLGVHPFAAGTTGKVVLGDVAGKSVVADAVRFTKWGSTTKKRGVSSVWNSFAVRNVVQEWVNNPTTNNGFMIKAVDEGDKGRGGPVYEASEYAYDNARRDYNLPKLVITFGRPGVGVHPPTTVTATGAALSWPAYTDPSGSTADDLVEYQVHRSIYQTFVPSAATLVAPVGKSTLAYQDTTALPTPTEENDPLKRHFYYYMIAVKTADGQIVAGPTQGVLLPKAGRVTKVFRETTANQVPDTTLSAALPTTNVNVYDGDPYVSPGNNSTYYGDTRGLVKFANLTGIPAGAQVVDAELQMWNTYVFPGTTTDGLYDVHRLTRAFDETTATWTKANSTTNWTTPGGDFAATAEATRDGVTNDPEWQSWTVTNAVKGWLATPSSNNGFLVKLRDEAVANQRAMLLSSEGAEPLLRPTLQVTYLEATPASTYYAPATPELMKPGESLPVTVSVSNPTGAGLSAANWELSYHWALPDGTDVTNGGNQVVTALPKDIAAGATVDVAASVKAPIQSGTANKRTDYVLTWELHNKTTGQWLSATNGIAPLDQKVAVEEPTSNQLGLEHFYSYASMSTGAGGTLRNNLYAGNTSWSLDPFTNPSRGLATFLRMTYNSQDTTDTVAGFGWSLQASSMMRLGTPLDFHPNPNPTTVTFTDGDGTAHKFSWDSTANEWKSPFGVHLFLRKFVSCTPQTEHDRAWSMVRPDRTEFFYDCDGYLSSIEDNNGNRMNFVYEVRQSQNKPTKFLRYITDPTGRQTLTLNYWAKGDTYDYINDTTWTKVTGQSNLTNPKIIDHVRSISEVSGRTLTFTYTDKGLLGEVVDGAGAAQPKRYAFQYDMTQGNKNVKLVKVTDPRGNATNLTYYSNPEDDPKFKWNTKAYADRLGGTASFAYTDPDGPQGSVIHTAVTDALNHVTSYVMDGYGRQTQSTDAKNQTTKMSWDADHNVVRMEEANGAVSTWAYDPKTGYPTEIRNAESVKNGWPGITLAYQTGLNGRFADLIAKQSPEGRRWTFGYDTEGNLTTVTDPIGTGTPTAGDYTTTYTYDEWGQLLSAKDANGGVTTYTGFDANGYPATITDALNNPTAFVYDVRGNVTKVTDARGKSTTQAYDVFGRMLEATTPKDQSANKIITVPAPVYDPNDNVTVSTAANGAVTTSVYDAADHLTYSLLPVDTAGDPQRKTSYTYDPVGNLLTITDPKGNLTAAAGDYTTTYAYDVVYQLVTVTDADGGRLTTEFDSVGNAIKAVDAKKNASASPDDYTAKYEYDLNHRVVREIDAAGHAVGTTFDRDGLTVRTTDQEGVTTELVLDPRGMVIESKVPHKNVNGAITYRITKHEYDQVGNTTKTTTPRGVDTADDADDFAQVTVYDKLNRPAEVRYAFDKDDARLTTPDKTIYTYDAVGNTIKVSAPPSQGQTVRNDTVTTYYDNGWVRSSTDPWDIVTSYDYNDLGQQISATLSSAGGSVSRTLGWQFYPDGKQKARTDSGVPVGLHVVLVDNSDGQNTAATGTWATSSAGTGFQGYDYRTHAAGGTDTFTWDLTVPADGAYDVFVRAPAVSGAATNAAFDVKHDGGTTTHTVDQSQGGGQWVGIGKHTFHEGLGQTVTLKSAGANGTVVADAVKLVRDRSADVDNESKTFGYTYDPNGNNVRLTDSSPGSKVDAWAMAYDGLDRLTSVQESKSGTVLHTTSFQYDPNSNPTTRTHDRQTTTLDYDARDAVAKVTVAEPGVPAKVTAFTYTPKGKVATEAAANGNTVEYQYYLDGLIRRQVEKRGATVVNEHTIDYDANSNPVKDVAKTQNADNLSAYLDRTVTYEYDPRDRIRKVVRSAVNGGGEETQDYVLDGNGNTIEQTVAGIKTTYVYDRNRLQSATAAGGTTSKYNYDPLGRLDTVTSGGQVIDRYKYDGFDRTIEQTTGAGEAAKTTRYAYDPMDRTLSRTEKAGTADAKTTDLAYLGLGEEVVAEEEGGQLTRTYHYGGQGERLGMVKHAAGGGKEFSAYGYTARGDVEVLTDDGGNARATYGYQAFGSPDTKLMTGVDKPDTANPDKEPYNTYRFNAKRMDPATGDYDMGARDYDPDLNRFLSRDMYAGALSDLSLNTDPFTMNRYAFAGGNPVSRVEYDGHFSWSSFGHIALDVVGLVPVVGEVADLANAAWYAAEGNYADAALSAAGAIPFVGWGAAAVKGGKYAYKGIDALQSGSKLVDDAVQNGTKLGDDVAGAGAKPADDLAGAGKPADEGVPGKPTPTKTEPGPSPAAPPPAAKSCKNSFVPATPVLMADGSTKAIEDVEVGDEVLATDPQTGRTEPKPVTALIVGEGAKHLVEITVDLDGAEGAATGVVIATTNHPVWVDDEGRWVDAGEVEIGDDLRTPDGDTVEVVAVKEWTEVLRVHNLSVDDIHTYYVAAGGEPVLVHNCTGSSTCSCANNTSGLNPGHSPLAKAGQDMHKDPAVVKAFEAMGYKKGPGKGADQPDFLTPNGDPVELKPFTPRGAREGTRQLRRYLNNSGSAYGELWGYSVENGLVVLRKMAVPKPGSSRRWNWLARP
ncbi:MAG: DNRLRE domain-containing protein [Hamadaea sp.]|nr:DNRLRE domain-containing protein [Hamadaea sp.]